MNQFQSIFTAFAEKTVKKADKEKEALYVTKPIAKVLQSAGIDRSDQEPHPRIRIKIIDAPDKIVEADYYGALRLSSNPPRRPEPRMGLEFIRDWLQEGDRLFIGNVGSTLFASRAAEGTKFTGRSSGANEGKIQHVLQHLDTGLVLNEAFKAAGPPSKRSVERTEFDRNQYVIRAALNRAGGMCEMPGCGAEPFLDQNRQVFLEVHHIIPLSEGGDDTLENVAAICPNCHREQHYGLEKALKRRLLMDAVTARMADDA